MPSASAYRVLQASRCAARPTNPPDAFEAAKHTNGSGRLLTADDLAERWQVKPSHVYRLTREGALPTVRLGRYYRYRVEVIDQFERGGGAADG
jgi:excisionase family DNA binding protein